MSNRRAPHAEERVTLRPGVMRDVPNPSEVTFPDGHTEIVTTGWLIITPGPYKIRPL